MITQPITDAHILYRPSKALVEFIKTLNVSEDDKIPGRVANIADNTKTNTEISENVVEDIPIAKEYSDYPTILKCSDIDYLNSLKLGEEDVEVNAEPAPIVNVNVTDKLLTFDDLLWLHQYLEKQNQKQADGDYIYFNKLFQGTQIILPKNEEIERNEELEARCVKLRNQERNREYKQMTKNVDNARQHLPEETISYQLKQINAQLVAVFQFVVSVLTGFVFGFLGVELMIGTLDFGFRLLLGIICALIVALAELYFLAKKLNEDLSDVYKPTTVSSNHHNAKVKTA